MVAEEDPEITSCHRHNKSTATYRKNSENHLSDYSTKEGKRASSRQREEAQTSLHQNRTPGTVTHQCEGSTNMELLSLEQGVSVPQ